MPHFKAVGSAAKEQSSDGVNLLVSMLVRYPQIGTINFEPDANSLKFTFIISGVLPEEDYTAVKELIEKSIDAYHSLLQINTAVAAIDISFYDEVSMLTIVRDIPTLSCGEIALIVSIINEQFAGFLAADINEDALDNEDIMIHDEVIETILKKVRKQNGFNKSLIGIREDGRVFVFNK